VDVIAVVVLARGIALALLFGRRWPLAVPCLVMAMSAINVAVFG
jgi:hypothetical protein